MARADEALHLHVLAGEIEDRGIVALLHPDGAARVGDHLAVERHAHALLRGLRLDAMIRVLLVAGSGITSRWFHRNLQGSASSSCRDYRASRRRFAAFRSRITHSASA